MFYETSSHVNGSTFLFKNSLYVTENHHGIWHVVSSEPIIENKLMNLCKGVVMLSFLFLIILFLNYQFF